MSADGAAAQAAAMAVRLRWSDDLDALPLPDGGALAVARLDWRCADAPLRLRVLSAAPLALPAAEPSEPAAAAVARVARALAGSGALLLLADPAAAFAPERMPLAAGCRLLDLGAPGAAACWDALLAAGQPCYGVTGELVCQVARPGPAAVLAALGFGAFHCEAGLAATALDEDRCGVALELEREAEIAVVVRGGFAARTLRGRRLDWRDAGTEGVVRLEARAGDGGRLWTQPRLVAPRPQGGRGHG